MVIELTCLDTQFRFIMHAHHNGYLGPRYEYAQLGNQGHGIWQSFPDYSANKWLPLTCFQGYQVG